MPPRTPRGKPSRRQARLADDGKRTPAIRRRRQKPIVPALLLGALALPPPDVDAISTRKLLFALAR
jgi:hypothetical protein